MEQKRGERKQRFKKKGGQAGSGGGRLKKGGAGTSSQTMVEYLQDGQTHIKNLVAFTV